MNTNKPRLVYYSAIDALIRAYSNTKNPELEKKLYELCGFTKSQTRASIPVENYLAILDYLAITFHGNLPKDEAYRQIGRNSTEGYKYTILGRIQFAAIKLMSPSRAARIGPANLQQNSNFGTITFEEASPYKYVYQFRETPIPGSFVAGCFEVGVETTKAKNVRSSSQKTGAESFNMTLEWD